MDECLTRDRRVWGHCKPYGANYPLRSRIEAGEHLAAEPPPVKGDRAIREVAASFEKHHSSRYGISVDDDIGGRKDGFECR